MARTVEEIIANADKLAEYFENFEPKAPGKNAAPLGKVRKAFEDMADSQEVLLAAIQEARETGLSWASIGAMVGTTGEAVRQKYGPTEQTTQVVDK